MAPLIRPFKQAWSATWNTGGSAGLLAQYVELMLLDELKEWFFLWYVFSFVIVSVIVLALENFAQDSKDDPNFPNILGSLNIVLPIALAAVSAQYLSGYEAPLVRLETALQRVRDIATYTAASGIHEAHEIIVYMIHLCDAVFRPGPPITEIQVPARCKLFEEQLNIDTLDYPKRYRFANRVLFTVVGQHSNPTIVQCVHKQQKDALVLIHDAERERDITPPFLTEVLMVSVVLVFLLQTTFQMWWATGPVHTLWAAPLLITILTSAVTHRVWLLSPWSSMRPWTTADHEHWPREFSEEVSLMFMHQQVRAQPKQML